LWDEIHERVLRLRETFPISSDFAMGKALREALVEEEGKVIYEKSAILIVVQLGRLDIFDSMFETVTNLMHLYMSRKWGCLALCPFIKSRYLVSRFLSR
jgi:hypothetical protein